jgi:hypothetical protein
MRNKREGARLAAVVRSVAVQESLFVFRQILRRKDRIGGACGYASTAIDTARWVDIKLAYFLNLGLISLGMNAVGGTNVHAKMILYAVISDNVCHNLLTPF